MNKAETTLLLAKVQSNDRRTVGEIDVLTWHEALEDIDPQMALDAVNDHIKCGEGWLTPKMVRDYVRGVERQRMRDAGPPDYPSGLTQAQERAYRAVWLDHVKRGVPAREATALADEALSFHHGEIIAAPDEVRRAITEFEQKRKLPRAEPGDAA